MQKGRAGKSSTSEKQCFSLSTCFLLNYAGFTDAEAEAQGLPLFLLQPTTKSPQTARGQVENQKLI